MRYYVLAANGERYGPADVPTLSQWAAEGRLSPTSRLMDEMSGNVLDASSLPGLNFPQATPAAPVAPMTPLPPGSPYLSSGPQAPIPTASYRLTTPGSDYMPKSTQPDPTKDVLLSFGMVLLSPILSLFCIYGFTTALLGIGAGWRAFQNGSKIALLPILLNVGALVFWVLSRYVFRWWLFGRYY